MAKKTSGGRPSKKRAAPQRLAGIDIGGTKINVVITNSTGKILGRGRKKTKADLGFKGVMERVLMVLDRACEEAGVTVQDLAAIGIGAPSPIVKNGNAVHAVNMGWKNVPLVKTFARMTGRPVFAENDCNVGALGEYALGAGRGAKSLIALFVGTGLGGGIVYQGELINGTNRMAAEIGHMIVVDQGRRCGCGHNGCIEAYVSKIGMGRRFMYEIVCQGRESKLQELCGNDFANVRSGILKKAYLAHDEVVMETLQESAHFLGLGIANLITLLGPDTVVIGGGVYEALGNKLLAQVKRSAKALTHPAPSYRDTRIVLAGLGDDAVALGAMVHARNGLAAQDTA